jgi:hypothetical protein
VTFIAGPVPLSWGHDALDDLGPRPVSDLPPEFEPVELEPIDLEAGDLQPDLAVGAGSTWPPGWYADPWSAGQYRRWNGEAWTGETHRTGPVTTLLHAPPTAASDPPVSPASPATAGWPTAGAPTAPAPPVYAPPAHKPGRGRSGAIVAGIIVIALLAGAVGYAIEASTESDNTASSPRPPATTAPGPITPAPNAADRTALAGLVVQQSDVGAPRVVVLIPNGNRTTQPTLDLCNGTFPSEQQRVARLQVAELIPRANPIENDAAVLSTEAVTYKHASDGAQAFAELRKVRAACPHRPVTSPVGGGTAETEFKRAPDRTWAHTKSVERLAYSFNTTSAGTTSPSIAVYLRRGRVLMGVYFPQPNGVQPSVDGKTSVESIVGVFEARMARLPAKVVG